MFGVELKAIGEVPKDGWAPAMKDHRFSKTQVRELKSIQTKGGGIGLGFIVCGRYLFWFTPERINETGQVDCYRLLRENKFIEKTAGGSWGELSSLLEILWREHKSLNMHHKSY